MEFRPAADNLLPESRETRSSRASQSLSGTLSSIIKGEHLDLAALIAEHPEMAPDLAALIRKLDMLDSEIGARSSSEGPGEPDMFTVFPSPFGEYEVLRKLGEGAMGQVYLARQTNLGRLVALKVIAPRLARDAKTMQRFLREAKAAGSLDHPAIVGVYEAGVHESRAFIAMRYVEGETLAEVLRREAQEQAARAGATSAVRASKLARFLRIVEDVARALDAAHEAGIIHRDIKPGNIMLTPRGPVILDLGLVRLDLPDGQTVTEAGDIIGTPAYVAPEVLREGQTRADRRSDVYSLGVTLYECLTLRRPFVALTFAALCNKVLTQTPVHAHVLNPGVSRDLGAILEMALEKDPERRYQTALELAEDLQRVRDFEPIRARPTGPILKFARWVRRNPLVATSTISVFLILAIALVVSITLRGRLEREMIDKDQALQQKDAALVRADGARLMALSTATLTNNPGLALLLAIEASRRAHDRQANNAVLSALQANREKITLIGHRAEVLDACFSPDGNQILTASADYSARLWDARTGELLMILGGYTVGGHSNGVTAVSFSPDGSRLATASTDRTAIVWDASAARKVALLEGHQGAINSVCFSPDGRRVLTASTDDTAKVWDIENGEEILTLRGHQDKVQTAWFSHDGSRIVTGSWDRTFAIWDAESGMRLVSKTGHEGAVSSACFDPTGERVLTASRDGTVGIWDAQSGSSIARWKAHEGEVLWACFGVDGSRIFTCSSDLSAKAWDAVSRQELLVLLGHTSQVYAARPAPDGRSLVTASEDGTARIWNVSIQEDFITFLAHADQVSSAAFSADGRRVVTSHGDGAARVWDCQTGELLRTLAPHEDDCRSAVFSADGTRVLTASSDRSAAIWELTHGGRILELRGHKGDVTWAEFSPDGGRVVTASRDKSILLWDAAAGTLLDRLGTGGADAACASFSPDGVQLAAALRDGTARVWDMRSRQVSARLEGHGSTVLSVQFSRDSRRIVTAAKDKTARVWDAASGKELLVLRGHGDRVAFASFSPDGREIVTASWDKTARIWDASSGVEKVAFSGHKGHVHTARFSPAGDRVLTASADGAAISWIKDPLEAAASRRSRDMTPDERDTQQVGSEKERAAYHKQWSLRLERLELDARGRFLSLHPDRYGAYSSFLRSLTKVLGILISEPTKENVDEFCRLALDAGRRILSGGSWERAAAAWSSTATADRAAAILALEEVSKLAAEPVELLGVLDRLRRLLAPEMVSFASVDARVDARTAIITRGASWRFFQGWTRPSASLEWTDPSFDDSSWEIGPSEFTSRKLDAGTTLKEMRGSYKDLYLRGEFSVPADGRLARLVLIVAASDGFIAYLNGEELGRMRAGAGGGYASSLWRSDQETREPFAAVELLVEPERLRRGRNVVAVHGAARTSDSIIFYLLPTLRTEAAIDPGKERDLLASFRATARGSQKEARGAYLEGRFLQRAGDLAAAARKFADVNRASPLSAEPILWLVWCLEALGDLDGAEARLRGALDAGHPAEHELWDAWARVALGKLGRRGAETLASLPGRHSSSRREDIAWVLEQLQAVGAIRIDCGGSGGASACGVSWAPDRFYVDDFAFGESLGEVDDRPLAREVEATEDDALYVTGRSFPRSYSGGKVYRIPLPRGRYRVGLHFAELRRQDRGGRVFGLLLEDECVLEYFEPLAAGFAVAQSKRFEVIVDDGVLDIGFLYTSGLFRIAAIEVESAGEGE